MNKHCDKCVGVYLHQNTIDVILYFGPPALEAALYRVKLLVGDAVWGRVGGAVHGESALGEGLVYGGPLAAGHTGHQALGGICVFWFTEGNRHMEVLLLS